MIVRLLPSRFAGWLRRKGSACPYLSPSRLQGDLRGTTYRLSAVPLHPRHFLEAKRSTRRRAWCVCTKVQDVTQEQNTNSWAVQSQRFMHAVIWSPADGSSSRYGAPPASLRYSHPLTWPGPLDRQGHSDPPRHHRGRVCARAPCLWAPYFSLMGGPNLVVLA